MDSISVNYSGADSDVIYLNWPEEKTNDLDSFIILGEGNDGVESSQITSFWSGLSSPKWNAYKESKKLVEEAPYHPGYEGAVFNDFAKPISEKIKERLLKSSKRFNANDNISEFIKDGEIELLVDELTGKFASVLDTLVIDRQNDPNSHGTAKRLAKMYIYEIMAGRYEKKPDATAFPNVGNNSYHGMLVVRSELKSICSHHHQPVTGVAYIGVIPGEKVIGLSKYTRIAQWCSRRGTLQEELCNDIANNILLATDSEDVAVYIQAQHGCCENRGILAHSSLTQTTVLHGKFWKNEVKQEFFDNIKLQQQFSTR
jgi:GTP cyclohydrolase IA